MTTIELTDRDREQLLKDNSTGVRLVFRGPGGDKEPGFYFDSLGSYSGPAPRMRNKRLTFQQALQVADLLDELGIVERSSHVFESARAWVEAIMRELPPALEEDAKKQEARAARTRLMAAALRGDISPEDIA